MPALGEILRRFRFHGVPGAPTLVAVPADGRAAQLEAELAPVFAALADAQRDAADAVRTAEADARERRQAAAAEAQRIVSQAHAGVVGARDQAATDHLGLVESECARVRAAGQAEAVRIARVDASRLDGVADSIVAYVLGRADGAATAERPTS